MSLQPRSGLLLAGVTVMLLFADAVVLAQTTSPSLKAGAAKVDITPHQSDLIVATDSIRDHQFARAIVVDNGITCAVLLSADTGDAQDDLIAATVPGVSAATKCPVENIVVTATHSHSTSIGHGADGKPSLKTIADALISAAATARSHLATARVGYGTTNVDLNVNRDVLIPGRGWTQGSNYKGPSDKTLAVVAFIGTDEVPIGVYINYGMHPINFYLSGVISSDFPGEASRYVEKTFDDRTVALFSQSESGDQNPQLAYSPSFFIYQMNELRDGHGPFVENAAPALAVNPPHDINAGGKPSTPAPEVLPIPAENLPAYHKAIERTGEYVTMMGTMLGTSSLRVIREQMQTVGTAEIWGKQETFSCPGRTRVDQAMGLENAHPSYTDGPPASITVGLVRIGDINFVWVNSEIYAKIGMRLKAEAPASKTLIVTRASGYQRTGYIYADEDADHLTFEVLSSRLRPGCAEGKIISTAISLMHKSGE